MKLSNQTSKHDKDLPHPIPGCREAQKPLPQPPAKRATHQALPYIDLQIAYSLG